MIAWRISTTCALSHWRWAAAWGRPRLQWRAAMRRDGGVGRRAVFLQGDSVEIGVSIGVTMATSCAESADPLMKSADVALYHAKERGRHMSWFFAPKAEQNLTL
jgi:GGDEF domain-containing protein